MHPFRFLRSLLPLAIVAQALASPILYYTAAETSNGLGKSASNAFTTAVTGAFGAANVVEIANFANAADFDDGAALFVNARNGTDTLSAQEQANLLAFAQAGGAVFFIGDHSGWLAWDNSFLSLFGDSYIAWNGVNAALSTNALPGYFAPNTQIGLSGPGAITGGHGTALFTTSFNGAGRSMASIYGPNENVMAFLDTNAFGGTLNPSLYSGLSSWLFDTASAYEESKLNSNPSGGSNVPDAVPTWCFAPVLFGFAILRRRTK